MKNDMVIESIIGFDFNLKLIDSNGNIIPKGAKTTDPITNDNPVIGTRIGGENWFTNWNKNLLEKIKDYKRLNVE
jgi:hypothetical protein